jgi:hypothetical protein
MMKAMKKSPQKKVDTMDDVLLTIEFQLKKLSQKTKQYTEQIEILGKSVDFIEKATKQEVVFKASELYKEFADASALATKLAKDLETQLKRYHKIQMELDKKLTTPLTNGKLCALKPTALEEITANIKRIEELLNQARRPVDNLVTVLQIQTKRLSSLENLVHSICLPEQIEEINKLNDKLNKYAEMLCKETASLSLNSNPKVGDPQKIKTTLLHLYAAHQKGGQMLEQVQKNIGPIPLVAGSNGTVANGMGTATHPVTPVAGIAVTATATTGAGTAQPLSPPVLDDLKTNQSPVKK